MPRLATKTVFHFDELSDHAKGTARDWFREASAQDEFWDATYEDAATIADMLGIDLRQETVKLMGGGTRYDPCIYFSGFASQGDGASFEGSYSYRKGSVAAVKAHAPQDAILHEIAEGLAEVQKRNFYRLQANAKIGGRFCHEMSMNIDVEDSANSYRDLGNDEETVRDLLRDFARWVYRQLEAEWEHVNSDETVDENILCNGYEFDEDGRLAR